MRFDLRGNRGIDLMPCLLVEHPSGITWANQVGGVAVMPAEFEGILVPLDAALKLDDDPLTNHAPFQGDPVSARERISRWLRWAGLEWALEPRDDAFVAEAWIPVRVRADLAPDAWLGAFAGRRAIVTYENSD